MKNTEWKNYVKQAKLHLRETEAKDVDKGEQEEIFYVNSHRLTKIELKKIDESVKEIVASDSFVSDPLGRMIDNSMYDTLSDSEKMKYLLDLSKIYLFLRTKLENKA